MFGKTCLNQMLEFWKGINFLQTMHHPRITMPAKSKNPHFPVSSKNGVPDFNPDTLRSLTDKIESNLIYPNKRGFSKGTPAKPKTKMPKFGEEHRQHAITASKFKFAVSSASNGSMVRGKQKPAGTLESSQRKKRLRDGRVKEEDHWKRSNDVNSIKLGSRNRNTVSNKGINFEEELRALGGTKEDVDLIAEIASGSEMEGEEATLSSGSGLEKETLQLIRQLGVDRVGKRDLIAESEPVEADEVEMLEEDIHPEMIASNAERIGSKPALSNATSAGKGQRSLVSKQPFPFVSGFRFSC